MEVLPLFYRTPNIPHIRLPKRQLKIYPLGFAASICANVFRGIAPPTSVWFDPLISAQNLPVQKSMQAPHFRFALCYIEVEIRSMLYLFFSVIADVCILLNYGDNPC